MNYYLIGVKFGEDKIVHYGVPAVSPFNACAEMSLLWQADFTKSSPWTIMDVEQRPYRTIDE